MAQGCFGIFVFVRRFVSSREGPFGPSSSIHARRRGCSSPPLAKDLAIAAAAGCWRLQLLALMTRSACGRGGPSPAAPLAEVCVRLQVLTLDSSSLQRFVLDPLGLFDDTRLVVGRSSRAPACQFAGRFTLRRRFSAGAPRSFSHLSCRRFAAGRVPPCSEAARPVLRLSALPAPLANFPSILVGLAPEAISQPGSIGDSFFGALISSPVSSRSTCSTILFLARSPRGRRNAPRPPAQESLRSAGSSRHASASSPAHVQHGLRIAGLHDVHAPRGAQRRRAARRSSGERLMASPSRRPSSRLLVARAWAGPPAGGRRRRAR